MAIDPSTFPPTPHSVVWQPKKDTPRGGTANDGKADSLTPGATVSVYAEAKDSDWAFRTFGVAVDRQPYLIVGKPSDVGSFQAGDILTYGTKTLRVEAKPKIYGPYMGFTSAELVATDQTTGGR